jgi:hypothetical protein
MPGQSELTRLFGITRESLFTLLDSDSSNIAPNAVFPAQHVTTPSSAENFTAQPQKLP